jgi:HTH-type transcriptional regulator/antitoxin HipB
MKDIPTKTAEALGMQLRARRMALGFSQAALARRVGVERKWIIRLEAGNPVAELGSVLRAIEALGCELLLHERTGEPRLPRSQPSSLDEVFSRLNQPRKP